MLQIPFEVMCKTRPRLWWAALINIKVYLSKCESHRNFRLASWKGPLSASKVWTAPISNDMWNVTAAARRHISSSRRLVKTSYLGTWLRKETCEVEGTTCSLNAQECILWTWLDEVFSRDILVRRHELPLDNPSRGLSRGIKCRVTLPSRGVCRANEKSCSSRSRARRLWLK